MRGIFWDADLQYILWARRKQDPYKTGKAKTKTRQEKARQGKKTRQTTTKTYFGSKGTRQDFSYLEIDKARQNKKQNKRLSQKHTRKTYGPRPRPKQDQTNPNPNPDPNPNSNPNPNPNPNPNLTKTRTRHNNTNLHRNRGLHEGQD